jgi:hypothetical protein
MYQFLCGIIIELVLPKANFNLYRGLSVPVYFQIQDQSGFNQDNVSDHRDKLPAMKFNRFLSGRYFIKSIEFIFETGTNDEKNGNTSVKYEISQKITIVRREWPSPELIK